MLFLTAVAPWAWLRERYSENLNKVYEGFFVRSYAVFVTAHGHSIAWACRRAAADLVRHLRGCCLTQNIFHHILLS